MSQTKWLSLIGGLFGFVGCGWVLWISIADREAAAMIIAGVYLIALAASVYGMWREQDWAVWSGRILAAAAFVFGGYLVHFSWTFWIFQEPTLRDRILAVFQPQILTFTFIPVLWLLMSFNLKKKGL